MSKGKGKGSFGLAIFGFILIAILVIILFRNEGNHVNREKSLKQIKEAVQIDKNDTLNLDGRMVTFYGETESKESVSDKTFNLSLENIIKLKRSVSSYQWIETSESEGDDTTYTYEMDWSDDLIDSNDFHTDIYDNPSESLYENKTFSVDFITIGAYRLASDYIDQLKGYTSLETITISQDLPMNMQISNGRIFVSNTGRSSISRPALGDSLITYEIMAPSVVTVLGKVAGSSLIPYETNNGQLAEVAPGEMDKSALLDLKLTQNNNKTWAIRIASIIGLMIAFGMIFSPIKNTIGKVPLLGNIVNASLFLISVISGAALGFFVIAIGWLFFKPLLAIGLIALAVGLIYYLHKKKMDGEQVVA